ncbi:branched-chain amino acid transport system II carrier protein [Streptococcus sp. zg-JUN1979]|uniref:branched-chain amino acid transport system II carrier protein n=1 Tax=Streptococcus sp. zg-JUN1979 TaxID=3391450 RepID=UPI0039A6A705
MRQKSTYWIVGLMLFALFFGAANLIYPALLGIYSGANIWQSVLGFIITGVTLPLLGVVAVAYSGKNDVETLAAPASKGYARFFAIALYLSIGPFFAIPRTGATSYSVGIAPIFGNSLAIKVIYGLFFFGLSYILAIRPSKIADRIGKYLTPTLLLILLILIIASFISPAGDLGQAYNASAAVSDSFKDLPFVAGLIQGYGTMDALAALAFAVLVVNAAKHYGANSPKEIAQLTLKSGVIAAVLLAAIYVFVARIGATSQSLFSFADGSFQLNNLPIDGGNVLSQASSYYMGNIGQAILAMAIFLACVTTSTGLITACAEYFHKTFPRLSHVTWATIFTLIATLFYFGGLSELIKWSLPVLFLLYPLTIVLILLVFLKPVIGENTLVYRSTVALTAIPALYDALSTLSAQTELFQLPESLNHFFTSVVPLGNYNMGYITFALVGLVISTLFVKVTQKN